MLAKICFKKNYKLPQISKTISGKEAKAMYFVITV